MYYSIRHLTKFLYSNPIRESVMETHMHPRSDANQRCLTFHLSVSPRCRVFSYRDHLANHVHHFDIPGKHGQLVIIAEALVEVSPAAAVPSFLAPDAWTELDNMVREGDYWEMLFDSEFATPTPVLDELAKTLEVYRRDDPLMMLHELNERIYKYFDYVPKSTKVDSPIDVALNSRMGVCQDFAHIMITLVRRLGIPCRYVSGYLHHNSEYHDRSESSATHAWVEALVPQTRLGRLRSDEPSRRRHAPHPHRHRPRLLPMCRRPTASSAASRIPSSPWPCASRRASIRPRSIRTCRSPRIGRCWWRRRRSFRRRRHPRRAHGSRRSSSSNSRPAESSILFRGLKQYAEATASGLHRLSALPVRYRTGARPAAAHPDDATSTADRTGCCRYSVRRGHDQQTHRIHYMVARSAHRPDVGLTGDQDCSLDELCGSECYLLSA